MRLIVHGTSEQIDAVRDLFEDRAVEYEILSVQFGHVRLELDVDKISILPENPKGNYLVLIDAFDKNNKVAEISFTAFMPYLGNYDATTILNLAVIKRQGRSETETNAEVINA